MLELGAGVEAELEVGLVMKYGVAIQGKLSQLGCILERGDVLEFLNSIVRKEDALKSGAVVEACHAFDLENWSENTATIATYKVPAKVQLCQ